MRFISTTQLNSLSNVSKRMINFGEENRNSISFIVNKLYEEMGEFLEALDNVEEDSSFENLEELHGEIVDYTLLLFQLKNNIDPNYTIVIDKDYEVKKPMLRFNILNSLIAEYGIIKMGLSRKSVESKYHTNEQDHMLPIIQEVFDLMNFMCKDLYINKEWYYGIHDAIVFKCGRCLKSHGLSPLI